jgi:hypothetical protein
LTIVAIALRLADHLRALAALPATGLQPGQDCAGETARPSATDGRTSA